MTHRAEPATLHLMVGLPGAGKTMRAREIAACAPALRLTPDEWMIAMFGPVVGDFQRPGGERWVLEGRLVNLALQVLRLGSDVVLDFGLWARDERSALRWLAREVGARSRVVYVPVDREVQMSRLTHRRAAAIDVYPLDPEDVDGWRARFEVPTAEEIAGDVLPSAPAGWIDWARWAEDHWPSCTTGEKDSPG